MRIPTTSLRSRKDKSSDSCGSMHGRSAPTLPESNEVGVVITSSALIRQDEKILLVFQFGAGDPYPTWALPGGKLEHGESLAHGLVREVREETGLIVDRIDKLVSVTHLV